MSVDDSIAAEFVAQAPRLTGEAFRALRSLVFEESGIALGDTKKALVVSRLASRVRQLGLQTFAEYYEYLVRNPPERVEMLDRISTNETKFFRESHHFDTLTRVTLPALIAERGPHEPKIVRIWSAGCATGEEPYSIAMCVLDFLKGRPEWAADILATDLSTRVLAAARRAIWPLSKAADIPERYLKAFMLKGTGAQADKMKAGRALRRAIRFERRNLNEELPAFESFDIIFCRNVLIYFDDRSRPRAVERLARQLRSTGSLFLGHSESLTGFDVGLVCTHPNVYQRRSVLAGKHRAG